MDEPTPSPRPRDLILETRYLGHKIDLRRFLDDRGLQEISKDWGWEILDRSSHPLVIRIGDSKGNRYFALTKFGAAGFLNISSQATDEIVKKINQFVQNPGSYDFTDTLPVKLGADEEKVSFDLVAFTEEEFTADRLEILFYVPAQSVALDRLENDIDKLMGKIEPLIDNLRLYGNPKVGQKELLKMVGEIISLQEVAVGTLSLLDKPDKTWDKAGLYKLYEDLSDEYSDMKSRFDALNAKVDILKAHLDTFLTIAHSQKSIYLEKLMVVLDAVIVALIIIEILHAFS